MGLLDQFSDFIKTPEGQGLLAGAAGWAANARSGTPWNNIGRGGLAGLAGYANAIDRQQQADEQAQMKKYRGLQMDTMQMQMEAAKKAQELKLAQEAWKAKLPEMIAPKLMGSDSASQQIADQNNEFGDFGVQRAAELRQPQGISYGVDQKALQSYLMDPSSPFADKLMEKQLFPKEKESFTLGADQVRYDGNGNVVARGPDKKEATPAEIQGYQLAQSQGYKGSFFDYQAALKKAGATNSNTTVSIAGPENKYNQDIGAGLAASDLSAVTAARGAPDVVRNAQSIRAAIQNGAFTGSLADVELALSKALNKVGLVGPGRAASTEELISSLGKVTLSSIKSSGLGGGNGFTDKDRAFLESAASGQITATKENLLRVANLSERMARASYEQGQKVVGNWSANPSLKNITFGTSLPAMPGSIPEQSVVRTTNAPVLIQGNPPAPNKTGPKFLGFE